MTGSVAAPIGPCDDSYLEGHGDLVSRLRMEKKVETTMYYLGLRVWSLGIRVMIPRL